MRLTRGTVVLFVVLAAPGARAAAQAETTADPGAAPRVHLQSFSLIVPDYDAAKAWYVAKLGFVTIRDQSFGKGERFVLVAPPGQSDVGIVLQRAKRDIASDDPTMNADYSDRIGKAVNIVLSVSDVTAYADSLHARGVTLLSGPRQLPWGGEATFRDLYGNSFVLVGPLHARARRPE